MTSPSPSASRPKIDIDEYEAGVRAGNRTVLGRAITLVESTQPDHRALAQELLVRLTPHAGAARRVGITGVPGVGKSTFIDALGSELTGDGHRVAVLAVDPSSSRTGGSILGDKTRMASLLGRSERVHPSVARVRHLGWCHPLDPRGDGRRGSRGLRRRVGGDRRGRAVRDRGREHGRHLPRPAPRPQR